MNYVCEFVWEIKMTKKPNRNIVKAHKSGVRIFFNTGNEKPQMYCENNEVWVIPNSEKEDTIYELLRENCDLKFCRNEISQDFKFITLEHFVIFATDSNGNCFGTIGGFGNIDDTEYPVGYVTVDGKCGKIASHIKEFLELVNYFPYWREIIEYERAKINYSIHELEKKYNMNTELYIKNQKEIEQRININKNEKSIELLLSNLRDEDQFIVLGHRYKNLL